jgi:hypothetical protein
MKSHVEIGHALEEIIDLTSLTEVLRAIETICYGKAEHLETNWQDHTAAKQWQKAGIRLDKAQAAIEKLGL